MAYSKMANGTCVPSYSGPYTSSDCSSGGGTNDSNGNGIPAWGWALIGIGIAIGLVGFVYCLYNFCDGGANQGGQRLGGDYKNNPYARLEEDAVTTQGGG